MIERSGDEIAVQAAACLEMGKGIWLDGPLGRAASVSGNRDDAGKRHSSTLHGPIPRLDAAPLPVWLFGNEIGRCWAAKLLLHRVPRSRATMIGRKSIAMSDLMTPYDFRGPAASSN
jgi:hypothetical protein